MSELPATWQSVALGGLIELNPKAAALADDTQVGFVPMTLLGKSYLDTVSFQPKRWADVKRGYTHFRDGDVLLAKITPCFENGKAGLVNGLPNGVGAGSTEYFVCRPLKGMVNARYLLAYLKTQAFLDEGTRQMTGSVGHKRVPKEYLLERELPLPPLAEQTRIADQLDTLLACIKACNDHLDAIPGLLKRFRQAVLELGLSGDLNTVLREGSAIERDAWTPTTLGEVATIGTGSTPLRSNGSYFAPSGTPWITSAATGSPFVDQAQEYVTPAAIAAHRLKVYPPGTLLVAMYGEGKTRGQVSELRIHATINQACAAVTVDTALARTAFVKLALLVQYEQMRAMAEGGNQPNLNLSKVKAIPLLLPPLREQDEIIHSVEALLRQAEAIAARYKVVRTQAQRLGPQVLAKAFRGELVQQEPKDEPVSVLLQRLSATVSGRAKSTGGRPRTQPLVPLTMPAPQEPVPIDWSGLPNNEWAAPAAAQGHVITVCLAAVLRAWGQPMPELEARLAMLLCQQPRVFTAVLCAEQAKLWLRLVGDEAKPLPNNVARLQPAANSPWGQAIKGMRARGDLVETGGGDQTRWSLGQGASTIITAGWPEGRAAFVAAYLRAQGAASILPTLEPVYQEFVHVRAA